jgi:hypothetical protein
MLRFRSFIPASPLIQDDILCAAILRGAAFLARRGCTQAFSRQHSAFSQRNSGIGVSRLCTDSLLMWAKKIAILREAPKGVNVARKIFEKTAISF